jgi:hypothetical protein
MPSDFPVVAIVSAYNEADIIEQVVRGLIDQGIDVYILDDGSTDCTVAVVEQFLGCGVVGIERLTETAGTEPGPFDWERILLRKAQLAAELDARWFIHHDADEFRESPWPHLSVNDAIRRVDALGFNAIDFTSLDFWPVHDTFSAGDDVREAFPFYSQTSHDRVQIRCWKRTDVPVDLASSGGHDVRFPGRKVFPVRFILRHYPIRGQAHGERKVFQERRNRFLEGERARGWHVQYDQLHEGGSFIRDPSTLTRYDPDLVRIALALRHRDVEALEESLVEIRSASVMRLRELEACQGELARARVELGARTGEIAALRDHLHKVATELARAHAETAGLRGALDNRAEEISFLRSAVAEGARRLDEFHRSLSWRWTSPARAIYRTLRRR